MNAIEAMEQAKERLKETRKDMFVVGKPIRVLYMDIYWFAMNSKRLSAGDRVHFKREFGHSWDEYAIAVLTEDGRKVGYVDHYLSADMACNIEKGISYAAKFVKLIGGKKCPGLFRIVE